MASAIEKIRAQAAKDAKRYSEAQMNYGRGAGTQRKLLDAELEEKLKNEVYKAAFEAALTGIDKAGVAEKIRKKKGVQRAVEGGRKTIRAARRAENFYYRNKRWIDGIVTAIFGE
jgi:hypothetical protein